MPSPFPGMDPYLEGEMWTTFHHQFAVEIARALNPRLVPRYYAYTEKYQNAADPEEIGIALAPESLYPDISVARTASRGGRRSAAQTLTLAEPLKLETVLTIPSNHFEKAAPAPLESGTRHGDRSAQNRISCSHGESAA